MLLTIKDKYNKQDILDELLKGSGVVVIKDVYNSKDINLAREIINNLASTQEQKESHFNAEAEASGKIHLQQRVWNLFGKSDIFGKLISHDIIFDLMSSFLGTEFTCGSYCASRLMPGAPGQELHIDYPYWDYYKLDTFPMGLNSSFPQNCQATIPLDVCSELSGATAYVPGSQKNLHYPNNNDDFSSQKQMTANPGDLVLFNNVDNHSISLRRQWFKFIFSKRSFLSTSSNQSILSATFNHSYNVLNKIGSFTLTSSPSV